MLDEFLIEIHPIGEEHVSKGALVLIVAVRLDGRKVTYHGGDGQFAFVTLYREVHYSLWPSKEEADKRKAKVDRTGCGGECRHWTHFILDLSKVAA